MHTTKGPKRIGQRAPHARKGTKWNGTGVDYKIGRTRCAPPPPREPNRPQRSFPLAISLMSRFSAIFIYIKTRADHQLMLLLSVYLLFFSLVCWFAVFSVSCNTYKTWAAHLFLFFSWSLTFNIPGFPTLFLAMGHQENFLFFFSFRIKGGA